MVLPGFWGFNFVRLLHKAVAIFCQTCQLTMKKESQNHAKARPVARSEELKHSVSTVAAPKNPVDAGIVFDGWPLRNRFLFPVDSSGQCGRKFQNAFCFIMKHLPVCLRVGFQFDGRIND